MKNLQNTPCAVTLRQFFKRFCLKSFCAAWLVICAGYVNATPIDPGFDLFSTPGDGTSFADLTSIGLGIVTLGGNSSLLGSGLGNTDTIVARKEGIGPFPVGDSGTIDIELVALSLRSVAPVDLTPLGGPFIGVIADMFITINHTEPYFDAAGNPVFDGSGVTNKFPDLPQPDVTALSEGTMDISHTTADGGTFSASFASVFADAIFTVLSGNPNDPLDILLNTPAPRITLSSTGNWTHTRPDSYPVNSMFPAGDFYIGDIDHTGPHQPVVAQTPAPATLALFGIGLVALGRYRRKSSASFSR